MAVQILESYIMIIFIGFILGIIATRYYYKRNIMNLELGQVIEAAMINKNIEQMKKLSDKLLEIIQGLKLSGEELSDQVKHAQNIERPNIVIADGLLENFEKKKHKAELIEE